MTSEVVVMPDLFLDPQERLKFRDLTSLMEFPFFSISKNKSMETRIYDDGKVRIEVKPGEAGLATIWDKDVLLYVASQINRMLNEGQPVSQKVRFHAHDFFVSCGRSKGGRSYEDLIAAFDRLQSTSIRTNIAVGAGETERSFFSWIKRGRMAEHTVNGKKVLGVCEVEMEDWVWRQIVEDRSILAIDSGYFQLTSGIARRIYELARKHCGRSASWTISLPRLAEKIGYDAEGDMRNFKRIMADLVASDDLPEYHTYVALAGDATNTKVDNIAAVRGIKALKAVFKRRANVSDTRQLAAGNVSDRRVAQEDVFDRRPAPDNVFDTRAEATEPASEADEPATAAMFAGLVEQLAGKMKG